MVNFGPLAAEISPVVWGTLQISTGSHLGSVTAEHSPWAIKKPTCFCR